MKNNLIYNTFYFDYYFVNIHIISHSVILFILFGFCLILAFKNLFTISSEHLSIMSSFFTIKDIAYVFNHYTRDLSL